MRQRVEQHVPRKDADRQLKLGPGGLRDVEFSVQLLQLVHGRSDVMLRSANTLDALEALATWGYVGREDAHGLAGAYRFLRTLEHRHPAAPDARAPMSCPTTSATCAGSAARWAFAPTRSASSTDAWRSMRHEVRRIHEKLFYRPLLDARRPARHRTGAAHSQAARDSDWTRSASATRRERCATSRR